MQKTRINFIRLALLLSLALTTTAGNCTGGSVRRANFFPPFTARDLAQPPQDQLMLWLEGNALGPGASHMFVDSAGAVTQWADFRGGSDGRGGSPGVFPVLRVDGTLSSGQRISETITTPGDRSYSAFALRCGNPPRCAYLAVPPPHQRQSLDDTAYTILAVVQRASGRGDNHFVMTTGPWCDGNLGGINCTTNTVLHVGWSGERTIRLGQYGAVGREDVIFEPAPPFNANARSRSLFVAVSGVGEGKTIALLEQNLNDGNTVLNTTPLTTTRALFIGGTPFAWGQPMPNYHFEGDIFAVLIYTKVLTETEMRDAQYYLRNRYGPR